MSVMSFHVEPGYDRLARILFEALEQAQRGKGKERHATREPWENQPTPALARRLGPAAPILQVCKKAEEAVKLPREMQRAELLGAINYAAMAILAGEEPK